MFEELEKLLEGIQGTYDDFVGGVLSAVDGDEEYAKKICDFIKEDENISTSAVVEYLSVLGI